MNPFPITPTGLQPSRLGRFMARPAPIMFLLCFVLGLAAVAWRAKETAAAARERARGAAQARGAAVELQFSQALSAAEVLGALARQGGLGNSNFQKIALELLASRPGLASLELQPGGIVSDIVPRAGNERIIGFNVLKDEVQHSGAYAAMQRRVLTVTGPLKLFHGDPGIVVRVPVFQRGRDGRDSFWGFVATSMRLPEVLARAGFSELSTRGYNFAFFAPASAQRRAVTIAAQGSLPFQDAVEEAVRAQNLEFRLALRPKGGWVNSTKVALETLGVFLVSSLLGLLANLLKSGRQAYGVTEQGQMQQNRSGVKDGATTAQAEFRLAELQTRLEGTMRRTNETNEIAQAKLKQAELNARELQARLDAEARVAAEMAQAKQAEIDHARSALAKAQQEISDLRARLEVAAGAEHTATETSQARLQRDQATIAGLQTSLDAANRAAMEAAEISAAKLKQMEEQAEIRVAELSDLLQKAQTELKRLQNDSPQSAGIPSAVSVGQRPTELKEFGGGEAATGLVEVALEPTPAIAVAAAPVEQSSATLAGETPSPVPSASSAEPLTATPAPLAVSPATPGFTAEPLPHSTASKALAETTAVASVPQSKRALQQFVEQHADAPRKIREALQQGDLAAADQMVHSFKASAGDIEATAAQNAATALTRAVHEQADPDEIESRWGELDKAVRDLVADLKRVLKPKEGKPAPVHRSPAQQPANPAHLRKAMNEIFPLLADQDPGAKDCLKANRTIFHSAFTSEAYEEFEQFVKRGDFGPALEHLKKAARKHGISL